MRGEDLYFKDKYFMEQMGKKSRPVVEIGKRNYSAPHHWELLELYNLKFKKPTVICLSGNGTVENKHANSIAKIVESNLSLMFETKQGRNTLDMVDIISVKYAPLHGYMGELTIIAVECLANAILALLVNSQGERLNLEQAKQNMSRVSFFTFCAGNAELNNVIQRLNEKLKHVGYSESEIQAINNSTLEVSFAPVDNSSNRIPSVRVISKNDGLLGSYHFDALEAGGVIPRNQFENLNGIHLHQDASGKLYGVTRDANDYNGFSTAGSIQIISSCLINTYYNSNDLYFQPDEHNLDLIARDQAWNLHPTVIGGVAHQSPNADCVSQMMAWAQCKAVENSLQNFQSNHYIPNSYWHELMGDFKSIINGFDQAKLSKNALMELDRGKEEYEELRSQKKREIARGLEVEPLSYQVANELGKATDFESVMTICEKYDYYHTDTVLQKLSFLTKEEKFILATAKQNRQLQQGKKQGLCAHERHRAMLAELDDCDKDIHSVFQIMDKYNYVAISDVLPTLNYISERQKGVLKKLAEIKSKGAKLKLDFKMQFVDIPSFETMVNTLNHADSLEEAIKFVQQKGYFGIEYVLPAVQVLTPAEKNDILIMAGIKPKAPLPQEIIVEDVSGFTM